MDNVNPDSVYLRDKQAGPNGRNKCPPAIAVG